VHTTPLLREQHFGIAEGKLWSNTPVSKSQRAALAAAAAQHKPPTRAEQELEVYETIWNRYDKFPDGESLDDLALRAEAALEKFLWPHLDDAMAHHCASAKSSASSANGAGMEGERHGEGEEAGEGGLGYHVVFVSHGSCISEMAAALLRRSANARATAGVRLKGLPNTGWTRLHIRPLVSHKYFILVQPHSSRGPFPRKTVNCIFRW
jgi:broad specificity phosphatase PhoE